MAAAAASSVVRATYVPHDSPRAGCPCKLISTCQVSTTPEGERTKLIDEFTRMKLVHRAKNGREKSSLRLDLVHHELELDSLVLQRSGASNVLLAKVSFDCLVKGETGEVRDYIVFDLKIPGMNTGGEGVFSFDAIAKAY